MGTALQINHEQFGFFGVLVRDTVVKAYLLLIGFDEGTNDSQTRETEILKRSSFRGRMKKRIQKQWNVRLNDEKRPAQKTKKDVKGAKD